MNTAIKKNTGKKRFLNKNEETKNNPFLEMIIDGLEKVEQKNWEHYLKHQIDFTPKNLFTKLPYNRFNRFTLMLDMMIGGFESPYYATFNQISKAGGLLKKGAKGRVIQYFSYVIKHKITGEKISLEAYKMLTGEKQNEYNLSSFVKYFRVFNAEFISNINEIDIEIPNNDEDLNDLTEINLSEDAEAFILKLKDSKGLKLIHDKKNTASYSPLKDVVTMPLIEWFKNETKYYSTLFHELIHWTGHENRLNRFSSSMIAETKEKYAFEELVAEMGAMLVYFDYNFKEEFINSLVYLKGWLKHTKEDSNKIEILDNAFKASNKAVSFLYS
ncbi:zincin-like metallopeptidase domain-containing protein [Flavobacterium daejeonense]|uniref:zincin-like metallopeptidase domain-containing protein n=1 Tax=Flavobacterium daejeonense TaxID=350893 RepID=UPI00047EE613|nr:zincin-like metallopeptidase domain-containing protein [Flavobacterium daejeonense]